MPNFSCSKAKHKKYTSSSESCSKRLWQKILRAIEKEIIAIQKYLTSCPQIDVEQVYNSLHQERKKLVTPIWEPDNNYIYKWKSIIYKGKGFGDNIPEFYTANGERVRSKSELIIADLLTKEGIPYRYEYPIYLKGFGRIYPDFTTLNIRNRKEIQLLNKRLLALVQSAILILTKLQRRNRHYEF